VGEKNDRVLVFVPSIADSSIHQPGAEGVCVCWGDCRGGPLFLPNSGYLWGRTQGDRAVSFVALFQGFTVLVVREGGREGASERASFY